MKYNISVIIPVYNAERYLHECIDSVLNQTFRDIEILLINDGSLDNSGKICDEYAQRYENLKVFHLPNGGPSKARNFGISIAQGDYIGFVDSDDFIDCEMFEKMYKKISYSKSDFVMIAFSIFDGCVENRVTMSYESTYKNEDIINKLATRYSSIDHNGLYSVCNKLFSREFLAKNSLTFDEELIRSEDAWFVFECLKTAKKVEFINEPLYHYRQVETSTMHTIQGDRFKRCKNFRKKLQKENELLKLEYDKNEFYYEFLYECFTYCRSMTKQKNTEAINHVLDDLYFKNACFFPNCLPMHLRVLCKLECLGLKCMLRMLLKLWCLI